jgi:4-aminobutyrate aminotransferase-like enzyme
MRSASSALRFWRYQITSLFYTRQLYALTPVTQPSVMAPSAIFETQSPALGTVTGRDKTINGTHNPTATDSDTPYLLHRSLNERPNIVASASGSYLTLEDGHKVFDACGGAAVAILGHGNTEVAAAVAEQMSKVSYVHTTSYGTYSSEDLARCILERKDDDFDHGLVKAFFVGSGSEANDAAMKCARQYDSTGSIRVSHSAPSM